MAIKFAYIDVDEGVYLSSNKPFDIKNLKPDPKGYTEKIIKDSVSFIETCEKNEYYDASAWTSLNETFNSIMDEIRSNETDAETKKPTEYYENEVRPVLKDIQTYIKYIRTTYKENTILFELAKEINPGYVASSPESKFFTSWIYNELKEKRIDKTDAVTTKKYLEIFTDISKTENLKIKNFTIYTLYDKLEELGLLKSTQGINEREREILKGKIKGASIIYQEGDWTVYKVSTEECAIVLGSNTNWCTAKNSARHYLDKCGYLVIFYFKGRPYSQVEPSSGEFKDKRNIKITTTDRPPYTLQDPELYKVFNKIKDPLFDEPIGSNRNSLKAVVLPAHKPDELWLQKVSSFDSDDIHQKLKEVEIKRYKILEPSIFIEDAPLMISEPYMKSWAESKEGRDSKIEEIIKEKTNWALSYACNVIRGPWAEAEPAIFKSEDWDDYVRYALKKSIITFLEEKLKLEYKNSIDFLNAYRSIKEICNNLKEYQRQYMDGPIFFSSILINADSADWLFQDCIENYTRIPQDIKIVEKDGVITEISNIKTNKNYKITELTNKFYKLIKERDSQPNQGEFLVSKQSTEKFLIGLKNLANSSLNFENINTGFSNDERFEKIFRNELIKNWQQERYYHNEKTWSIVLNIPGLNEYRSDPINKEQKELLEHLTKLKSINYNWEYIKKLNLIYGKALDLCICYFIYSNFYTRKNLLEFISICTEEKQRRIYIPLLIEKAILNKETSSEFWNKSLLNVIEKLNQKSWFIEKRKNRDRTLINEIVENINDPEFKLEFKKLFDPEYKRTTLNKNISSALPFIEILNMLDQKKFPNKEICEISFNEARKTGEIEKILKNWPDSLGTVPDVIEKFYKKNAGFIDLFDMLDLNYLVLSEEILAQDYFNPFISKGLASPYYSKSSSSLSSSIYYLNKIKDIPDFKIWISNLEKNLKNEKLYKKYLLNTSDNFIVEKNSIFNFELKDKTLAKIEDYSRLVDQLEDGDYLMLMDKNYKVTRGDSISESKKDIILFLTKQKDRLLIKTRPGTIRLENFGLTSEDLKNSLKNLSNLEINQTFNLFNNTLFYLPGDEYLESPDSVWISSMTLKVVLAETKASKGFLYSEKAIDPTSVSEALEALSEAQYKSDESILKVPETKIILATILNKSELKRLFEVCPGLFVQYVNIYKFEDETRKSIDLLILRLLKNAALLANNINLRTYAEKEKLVPSHVIQELLPYLATHHSKEESKSFISDLSSTLAEGIGTRVGKQQMEARIIREIKRFNK